MIEKNELTNKKRFEILDIYRGIAIILVLFRHHEVFPFFNKIGWIGVSLFFVLSGYLISGLLFKELIINHKINIKNFYIRRGFKIYPGFYFFTFFTFGTLFVLFLLTGHKADRLSINSLLIECFFLQNYYHGLWYHTWSIAIEEHFYLIFPLLLVVFKFNNIKNIKHFYYFTGSLILLVLIFRIINFYNDQNYEIYKDTFRTHLRIDGLVYGVMIGYDEFFNKSRLRTFITNHKTVFFIGFLITLMPTLIFNMESPITYTIGFSTISLSFAILLIYSLNFKTYHFKNLVSKSFIFIGTCSYAIYLWQGYILSFVMRLIEEKLKINSSSVLDFSLFLLISIAFGWFFTTYLENYFLKIRSKYFPSRT